ncbi:hypothetical protein AGMMS50230_09830 [Spirochaetia bacterium]|nr:hypothetical protein AGMMS50230_09830 [Spirochaetia bacterium]
MKSLRFMVMAFFVAVPLFLGAQNPETEEAGETAIARRYHEWALDALLEGRSAEALAALERGADYASVSSDLSYFLALARFMEGRSRFSALEACRQALETDRWELYERKEAQYLEAVLLVTLRFYEEALKVLERWDDSTAHYWRLRALKGLAHAGNPGTAGFGTDADQSFLNAMALAMDRFPRDPYIVRLLFEYAAAKDRPGESRALVDLALRRLPVLITVVDSLPFALANSPDLAYMAAPFIRDREEARRYVAAYRASEEQPNPESIPAALNLGLINGKQAVDELFARPYQWKTRLRAAPQEGFKGLDDTTGGIHPKTLQLVRPIEKDLILVIRDLLRSEDELEYLKRNLLVFSGVITEDRDKDGIVETETWYLNGMQREYRYDADQDGVPDITVHFAQGLPSRAEITIPLANAEDMVMNGQGRQVLLHWEQYPAVLEAALEGARYLPRPLDYFYAPVSFIQLVPGAPDYPDLAEPLPFLTGRSLLSFAAVLERPSGEFENALERIELSGGIPVKSTVYARDILGVERKAAETEFRQGRPFIQHIDLDLDGRMETIRRYDPADAYVLLLSESDWDGDGMYEYAETRQSDGTIKKSWDLNRDGIRETEQ